MIYLRDMVCFRYIILNNVYKGDDGDNDSNNSNNNNHNNKFKSVC
jgi:hypothetical protein